MPIIPDGPQVTHYLQLAQSHDPRDRYRGIEGLYKSFEAIGIERARQFVSDPQECEALVNLAFFKIFRRLRREPAVNDAEHFGKLLTIIIQNLARDDYRRDGRSPRSVGLQEELLADAHNPEQNIMSEADFQDIARRAKLSQLEQDVLYLRYWCGYDRTEVAENLGLKKVQVSNAQIRAFDKIRSIG